MNESPRLSAAWLIAALWLLPQALLALLNAQVWHLVQGELPPSHRLEAYTIGAWEAVLLLGGLGCALVLHRTRRPIGFAMALAALAAHAGYLWYFLQHVSHLIPGTIARWMLPETEVIFYQFSLLMPAVFLMLVSLARTPLRLSPAADVGLSLASLILVPAAAYVIILGLIRGLGPFVHGRLQDAAQILLIAGIVCGTAFILAVFLRLVMRLHALIDRQAWSAWAIPLAAGLVTPLAGLALNASIPFPYDFQSPAVYAFTVLNGIALLIPFSGRLALPGWLARAVFFPFSLYFFLVFLPFLPLSLLAMIAAGAGFLILAPVFLFAVHTRRLWEQGRILAGTWGAPRTAALFGACALVLPALVLARNDLDRRTLDRAVDALYSPDHAALRVPLSAGALRRALDRMDDMKHGLYAPYLTDLYNALVFGGMVLPDAKADHIRLSLLGETRPERKKNRWNFFGGGWRGGFQPARGSGVAHRNVAATTSVESRPQGAMMEAEVRFDLRNGGAANAEYSARIGVPEGVLVTGYWLEVAGQKKPGQIRERKAAVWIYEMIRDATRRDPGLVTYEDDRRLRLRVFPFADHETRRCGLTFRFPRSLNPVLDVNGQPLTLAEKDEPEPAQPVVARLPGGGSALALPAGAAAAWPAFRRTVVAHLILDCSAGVHGLTGEEVIQRAREAIEKLPAHIETVRFTWANYEQEDGPSTAMSRQEALEKIARTPALPFRGGFCPDRVIRRVLLANRGNLHEVSAFIVVPAPGLAPVPLELGAPFARLAPDLPQYILFDGQFNHNPIDPEGPHARPLAEQPGLVLAFKYGAQVTVAPADQDALLVASDERGRRWERWDPGTNQYVPVDDAVPVEDPAYLAGLDLWARHRGLLYRPVDLNKELPGLVERAREAGVLVPETALIVVESRAQEVMLARKEKQSLGAHQALEFDEVTRRAPAPSVLWLLLPAGWWVWRRHGEKGTQKTSGTSATSA